MELRYYQTSSGRRPFAEWLEGLPDRQARARVEARLARAVGGNLGDVQPVGGGVMEMRIDWGPGYRIYFARVGQVMVLLICGGDKRSQSKDIENAKAYFQDFKDRSTQTKRGA